jgi:uncharacterized protein
VAVTLDIKVIPNSGRQKFEFDENFQMKCYLRKTPENGKANAELIKLISKKLSIPQNNIRIIRGNTVRNKVVKIDTQINKEELLSKL